MKHGFWKKTAPTITTLPSLSPEPGMVRVRFTSDCVYNQRHVAAGTVMEVPIDDACQLYTADRIEWLSPIPRTERGHMPVQDIIRQRLQAIRHGRPKRNWVTSWNR